ncbi:MAG TPA: PEP-CTERM sorting domain-containing protein [Tepidisphaeraceae bacterium]|nr:PEP-CTERM sorting domain-containing protein [Tepidisphaeraceae bacterium]
MIKIAAMCFLGAATSAMADMTILSVSRTQANYSVGVASSNGISQGDSSYDNLVSTSTVSSVQQFNDGSNWILPQEIEFASHVESNFESGNLYTYWGTFSSDQISIEFSISTPQPFWLGFTSTDNDNPYNSVGIYSLSVAGLSLPAPDSGLNSGSYLWTINDSGILQPGIYEINADWGFGDPLTNDPYDYDLMDSFTFMVPEPASMGLAAMVLLAGFSRRRWRR